MQITLDRSIIHSIAMKVSSYIYIFLTAAAWRWRTAHITYRIDRSPDAEIVFFSLSLFFAPQCVFLSLPFICIRFSRIKRLYSWGMNALGACSNENPRARAFCRFYNGPLSFKYLYTTRSALACAVYALRQLGLSCALIYREIFVDCTFCLINREA